MMAVVFLLLLVLSVGPGSATTTPLYLLSLLSYPASSPDPAPSETDGPALLAAAELAVSSINSRPDVLPGYHLMLLNGSTGCNIVNTAVLGFVESYFYSGVPIAGVLGPACSTSAELLLPITNQPETALVAVHIANSALLADRERFPYSFGALDSSELYLSALLELVEQNSWGNISVIYDNTRSFFNCIVSGLLRELNSYIAASPVHDLLTSGNGDALELPFSRIVFLLVGADLFSSTVCTMFTYRLVYPHYQWVVVGGTVEQLVPHTVECSLEQLMEALSLSVFLNDRLSPLDKNTPTIAGKTAAELREDYLRVLTNSSAPSYWAPAYYDSVWALALALNGTMAQVNLSTYSYGMQEETQVIQQRMKQLDFEGFSGRISFDQNTGFVKRFADICQVQAGSLHHVGYYNGTTIVNSTGKYVGSELTILTASAGLGGFFLAALIVLLVLVAVCHVLTVLYSSHAAVKASSPNLLHVAYIGCYIFGVNVILLFVSRCFSHTPQIYCQLLSSEKAISSISFSLIFATICARTFRIYRIFVHYLNPGRFIDELYLFSFVFVVLAVDIVALLLWGLVNPAPPIETQVLYENRAYLRVDCVSDLRDLWIVGYAALLVVGSAVLATISLKDVKQRDFKTTSVLLLGYVQGMIVIPAELVYIVIAEETVQPDLELAIRGVMYLALIVSFLLLLFLPPLIPTIKQAVQRLRNNGAASKPP